VTINRKTRNPEPEIGPVHSSETQQTQGLTGKGPGLDRQEAAGQVSGRFWNRTKPFFWSEPGQLAGYPDPLLIPLGVHLPSLVEAKLASLVAVDQGLLVCQDWDGLMGLFVLFYSYCIHSNSSMTVSINHTSASRQAG